MSTVETTHIGDLVIEGNAGDRIFETIHTTNDYYESEILNRWLPYFKDDKVILDIGANLGNHTLFWAMNLPYDQIISFEPYLGDYERLTHNIIQNNLANILAINMCIGNQNGSWSSNKSGESNCKDMLPNRNNIIDSDTSLLTIDLFCENQSIQNINLIKIDIEGYEEQILAGMKSLLTINLPDIWVTASHQTYKTVMEQLFPLGYILADISGTNMLFLHPIHHETIKSIPIETILDEYFYNNVIIDNYYNKYNVTNNLLIQHDEQLLQLNVSYKQICNDLKQYQSGLNRIEDYLNYTREILRERDKQFNELQRQIAYIADMYQSIDDSRRQLIYVVKCYQETDKSQRRIIKQQQDDYGAAISKLRECITDYDHNIEYTAQFKKDIDELIDANAVLQEKLDMIKRHWLGRLAIRIYHLYKKIFKREK